MVQGYSIILKLMENEGKKRGAAVYSIGALTHHTPFRTLVFIMLSARSTDARTYQVCKNLFDIADTPEGVLKIKREKLKKILHPIGFYNTKTKNLVETSGKIIEQFNGSVPDNRKELMSLPGVGRKTANLVLNTVFGKKEIGVDVHVHKIANRLGWVKTKNHKQTELELKKLLPEKLWKKCNLIFVGYGQTVCTTKNPKCSECVVKKYCKRVGVSN